MGYLDNTSVTVDAVLTKKGREILSRGQQLNITSFTCSDEGVDYTLWNPDHPSGSAYYGEAIENLPMLEASVHGEYSLSNRLVTLNQDAVAIPALDVSGLTSQNTLTFEDEDAATGQNITISLKGYASGANTSLYYVLYDSTVIKPGPGATMHKSLSGTTRQFLREQDIPNAKEYSVAGNGPDWNIKFMPDTELLKSGRETIVYFVETQTGAWTSVTMKNNITRLKRNVISSATVKG